MSQDGVKVTRQEWLESLFGYLLPCPEGVELSQLGNEVPTSQCSEKLPKYAKIPKIDNRFHFHDGRLYAVPPENEKPVPTGPIGPINESADQFYGFLKEQPTNSSLLKEEIEEYFTRWKTAYHHRAVFAGVLKSLVKRKFLRFVHKSKRYVPSFRDPLVQRAARSALSVQDGIFVGEIKFEPAKPI
eukprot:gene19562-14185_t